MHHTYYTYLTYTACAYHTLAASFLAHVPTRERMRYCTYLCLAKPTVLGAGVGGVGEAPGKLVERHDGNYEIGHGTTSARMVDSRRGAGGVEIERSPGPPL